ncbi:TetR/AcrR family transcriptional regulator [Aeromicrobium sp. Leaf350]|uniref:TetR/AcrR family transcriptional regulator n=1 Tax=Aeromicrobium sp. Leaf350 TaxID=2876565 RepID=UPI001E45CBC4|nr:TetR/AcrR family transcriptional regulator [Aeromicrobium sp. Leaf350]
MARPRSFDADTALAAAVDDFWDSGYGATSTDELCRSTGLSRSSLYNAFGSKRDLYLQAILRYAAEKQGQRADLLATDLDGRALLRVVLTTVLDEQWGDDDRRTCLMINACVEVGSSDEEVRRALADNADDFRRMIADVVRRGQLDGSLTDRATADQLAAVLHAAVDGLQVRSRIDRDRDPVDDAVSTLLTLL